MKSDTLLLKAIRAAQRQNNQRKQSEKNHRQQSRQVLGEIRKDLIFTAQQQSRIASGFGNIRRLTSHDAGRHGCLIANEKSHVRGALLCSDKEQNPIRG